VYKAAYAADDHSTIHEASGLTRKSIILKEEKSLVSSLHKNLENNHTEGIKRVSQELRNLRRVKFSHSRLCNPSLDNIETPVTYFVEAS